MPHDWKVFESGDKRVTREFLAGLYKVDSLEHANKIVQKILPIISEHKAQHDTQISISDENLSIILHGQSDGRVRKEDWDLAKDIAPFLT
jgi:pterin-4a-carbinolamine dehydratase